MPEPPQGVRGLDTNERFLALDPQGRGQVIDYLSGNDLAYQKLEEADRQSVRAHLLGLAAPGSPISQAAPTVPSPPSPGPGAPVAPLGPSVGEVAAERGAGPMGAEKIGKTTGPPLLGQIPSGRDVFEAASGRPAEPEQVPNPAMRAVVNVAGGAMSPQNVAIALGFTVAPPLLAAMAAAGFTIPMAYAMRDPLQRLQEAIAKGDSDKIVYYGTETGLLAGLTAMGVHGAIEQGKIAGERMFPKTAGGGAEEAIKAMAAADRARPKVAPQATTAPEPPKGGVMPTELPPPETHLGRVTDVMPTDAELAALKAKGASATPADVPPTLAQKIAARNNLQDLATQVEDTKGIVGRYQDPDTREWHGAKSVLPEELQQGFSYDQIARIIRRGLAGEKLTARQSAFFEDLQAHAIKADGPISLEELHAFMGERGYALPAAPDEVAFEFGDVAARAQAAKLRNVLMNYEPARDGDIHDFVDRQLALLKGEYEPTAAPSGMSSDVVQAPNKDIVQKLAPASPELRAALDAAFAKPRSPEEMQAVIGDLKAAYDVDASIRVVMDEKYPVAQNRKVGDTWEIGLPLDGKPDELLHEFDEIRGKLGQPHVEEHDQNAIAQKYLDESFGPWVVQDPNARPTYGAGYQTAREAEGGPIATVMSEMGLESPARIEGWLRHNAETTGLLTGTWERAKMIGEFIRDGLRGTHGLTDEQKNIHTGAGASGRNQWDRYWLQTIHEGVGKELAYVRPEDRAALFDYMKGAGIPDDHPGAAAVKTLKEIWRPIDDEMYAEARKYVNVDYREDHFRIFFKVNPKTGESVVPMKLYAGDMPSFTHEMTIPDMSSAIALTRDTLWGRKEEARLGRELQVRDISVDDNPIYSGALGIASMKKFNSYGKALTDLSELGYRVRQGQNAALSADALRERNFVPMSEIKNARLLPNEPGTTAEYWVEANEARVLEAILSRDPIRESAAGRTLLAAKFLDTSFALMIPTFHAMVESGVIASQELWGGIGEAGRGLRTLDKDTFENGIRTALTSPLAPVRAAQLGGKIIEFKRDPAEFKATMPASFWKRYPWFEHVVNLSFDGGARAGISLDHKYEMLANLRNAFEERPMGAPGAFPGAGPQVDYSVLTAAVMKSVPAVFRFAVRPLFNEWIPRLRLGGNALSLARDLQANAGALARGEISEQTLARRSWNLTEDRMGLLSKDLLFWPRSALSALQGTILSLTWQLGSIGAGAKAVGGAVRSVAEFARDPIGTISSIGSGDKAFLDSNTSKILGLLATHALISTIQQTLMSGKAPWQTDTPFTDAFYPRTGELDERGKPVRMTPAGYGRVYANIYKGLITDPIGYPVRYMENIAAPFMHRIAEAIHDEDFYGRQVYDPLEPQMKKYFDGLKYALFGGRPFILKTVQRVGEEGTGPGTKALAWAGWQRASRTVDETPGETAVTRAYRVVHPYVAMDPEKAEQSTVARGAREILMNKGADPEAMAMLSTLPEKRQDAIYKNFGQGNDFYQLRFKTLPLDLALHVFDQFGPQEKLRYWDILDAKHNRATGGRGLAYSYGEAKAQQLEEEFTRMNAEVQQTAAAAPR